MSLRAEEKDLISEKVKEWVGKNLPWVLKKLFPKMSDKLIVFIMLLIEMILDWRRTGERP